MVLLIHVDDRFSLEVILERNVDFLGRITQAVHFCEEVFKQAIPQGAMQLFKNSLILGDESAFTPPGFHNPLPAQFQINPGNGVVIHIKLQTRVH